jgi:hypothetical protein
MQEEEHKRGDEGFDTYCVIFAGLLRKGAGIFSRRRRL